MMELLQELVLTAAISLLLALLIGKFVLVSASSGDHRQSHAKNVSLEVASVGGKLDSTVAAGTGDASREESIVGSEVRESEAEMVGVIGIGLEESMGKELKEEGEIGGVYVGFIAEREELVEDGADEVKVVRSFGKAPESSDVGKVEMEFVEKEERFGGGGVVGLKIISSHEDETGEKEVRLESGEQSLVGDGIEESKIVPVIEENEAMREIRLEGEVGRKVIEDVVRERALLDEDDDWEGIERSATGKFFVAANAFVNSASGSEALSKLSNDLQMQLYGLHKLATEGPCYETQPLALKVSARAKWHAWQRLGVMNPEAAMEQYMAILSDNVPGWMGAKVRDGSKEEVVLSSEEALSESGTLS